MESIQSLESTFAEEHRNAVYQYIRRRLYPHSDNANDLVQEVFLAAWENRDRCRNQSTLKSWLLGIARHKVEDYYRARLRRVDSLDDPETLAEFPIPARVVQDLEDRELLGCVSEVLEKLPSSYRTVLRYRYWEDHSAGEMARRLGRTEKAVERLLARARTQFRAAFICIAGA